MSGATALRVVDHEHQSLPVAAARLQYRHCLRASGLGIAKRGWVDLPGRSSNFCPAVFPTLPYPRAFPVPAQNVGELGSDLEKFLWKFQLKQPRTR
jgi:hypothetical protein